MEISLSHLCVWHFRYSMKQQGVLPTDIACFQGVWGMCCRKERYSLHTHLLHSLLGSLPSPHLCPQLVWLCWLKSTSEQRASSGLKFTEPREGPYSGALSLFLLKGERGWGQREEGRGSLCLLSWLVLPEGAPGHSMCPGWSQHRQPPRNIQKSLVSPSWLSMPQLCDYAGNFTEVSQRCLSQGNCFPVHISSPGHLWYTEKMKIETARNKSKGPTYCTGARCHLGIE